ncbi:MAG: branched-chain amino acid ABC transporter permease [Rhodospirillales bacterium]
MTAALSIAFDGLAYAMILFLISVGLSVTMGLMGFANLAHGAFAMVGGYLSITLMREAGVPFVLACVLAFFGVAAISVVFERVLYSRFYNKGELDQVLMTIGLVFMSIAACTLIWGPVNVVPIMPDFLRTQVDLGFRDFPAYRTFLIGVSLVIIVALWYGIERTRFGAQIRASVDNRRMAQSIGINVNRLFTLTFALGSGLAGIGGALGIDVLGLTPFYALEWLVQFMIVVAVGGLGSLRGAFVAALIIGVIDTAGKYYMPHAGAFFIYTITIVILLWRPQGLFGRA